MGVQKEQKNPPSWFPQEPKHGAEKGKPGNPISNQKKGPGNAEKSGKGTGQTTLQRKEKKLELHLKFPLTPTQETGGKQEGPLKKKRDP